MRSPAALVRLCRVLALAVSILAFGPAPVSAVTYTRLNVALTDAAGQPLTGVTFALSADNGATVPDASQTTQQDGWVTFSYVPTGSTITVNTPEYAPPPGFELVVTATETNGASSAPALVFPFRYDPEDGISRNVYIEQRPIAVAAPTATATIAPPTSTSTPTRTPTPMSTATAVPPTSTSTPTPTRTPTATPTATTVPPTSTPANLPPATATSTNALAATASPTATLTPSAPAPATTTAAATMPGLTPSATVTPTPVATHDQTATVPVLPATELPVSTATATLVPTTGAGTTTPELTATVDPSTPGATPASPVPPGSGIPGGEQPGATPVPTATARPDPIPSSTVPPATSSPVPTATARPTSPPATVVAPLLGAVSVSYLDVSGQGVAGSWFRLNAADCQAPFRPARMTDLAGETRFTNVPHGTYCLVESQAATGYAVSDAIQIVIDRDDLAVVMRATSLESPPVSGPEPEPAVAAPSLPGQPSDPSTRPAPAVLAINDAVVVVHTLPETGSGSGSRVAPSRGGALALLVAAGLAGCWAVKSRSRSRLGTRAKHRTRHSG